MADSADHLTGADQYYTGLVAQIYPQLRSTSFDPGRYAELIARHGEPALELGCGHGDPLLDLVAAGLDVDGIDSSADMIDQLHRRAAERGLTVHAEVATMEEMTPPRRYRTIFLAGPTFNLLPTDDHIARALERIAAALTDDGTAIVPLFIPEESAGTPLGERRSLETDDGWVAWSATGVERDEERRTQVRTLQYEESRGGDVEVLERQWVLHWITPEVFAELAARAGLDVVDSPEQFGPESRDVVLRRAG